MESLEIWNTQSSNSGIPRSPREVSRKQASVGEVRQCISAAGWPSFASLGLVHQTLTVQTPILPTHNGCFPPFLHRDSVVVELASISLWTSAYRSKGNFWTKSFSRQNGSYIKYGTNASSHDLLSTHPEFFCSSG